MNLQSQFDALLDTEEWMSIVVVFAAFLAGTAARNLIEPNSPFDLPDEVYGLVVMFGAQYLPEYSQAATIGGGVYTVDKLAERFDLKQTVSSFGGGN